MLRVWPVFSFVFWGTHSLCYSEKRRSVFFLLWIVMFVGFGLCNSVNERSLKYSNIGTSVESAVDVNCSRDRIHPAFMLLLHYFLFLLCTTPRRMLNISLLCFQVNAFSSCCVESGILNICPVHMNHSTDLPWMFGCFKYYMFDDTYVCSISVFVVDTVLADTSTNLKLSVSHWW
jgi:hypothetical protein